MKTLPLEMLRLLLGLLGMFFAYSLGRMATRLHNQRRPLAKAVTWVLRTAVVIFALIYGRGLDVLVCVLLALIVLSLGAGIYLESRPRKQDDEIHLFES